MKTYKCVKAWQRHGLGTEINEWEYTKLPINIKAGHFQEVEYVGASTTRANIVTPSISTSTPIPVSQSKEWIVGSKPVGFDSPLTDGDKVRFSVRASPTDTELVVSSKNEDYTATNKEVNVNSVGANFGNTPLTTFSSGNKFKDKIRPSKNEDDIRPVE